MSLIPHNHQCDGCGRRCSPSGGPWQDCADCSDKRALAAAEALSPDALLELGRGFRLMSNRWAEQVGKMDGSRERDRLTNVVIACLQADHCLSDIAQTRRIELNSDERRAA